MFFIEQFFTNFWDITNEISPYILLGVLIAGVMKKLLPDSFIKEQIGKDSKSSILKTALIGIPLPLCSCSVIPFATALKKDGASKSSLQTFLISAPISGVDSILVTQGALGWVFAIYRVITSFIIAIIAGHLSLWLDKPTQTAPAKMIFSTQNPLQQQSSCCAKPTQEGNFLGDVWNYGYHNIFKDIAKSLLIGLILASLVSTLMPTKLDNFITQNLFVSYLFMIVIAMPLYVCATSSIPLGLSLILAGFSPGSAFVFLSAGPATSVISMSIVKKLLGVKGLTIYLGTIFTCSIVFGYLMDIFLKDHVTIKLLNLSEGDASLLSVISSFVLLFLLFKTLSSKKDVNCGCTS